ncbi:hypothetical protein V1514DRAFT_364109 [Lipomyces japonicus]|uniref:uncharacterized protein n=1 Tax=Lipomyces japonicus TaxID=56871 RepID=UPI0034CF9A2E
MNKMPDVTRVNRGFHISHQKVQLDVDLASHTITGTTELTILPTDPSLSLVTLDFRQGKVTSAQVNGKTASWTLDDYWANTYSQQFEESARTVNQYDKYDEELNKTFLLGELKIAFPRGIKVQQQFKDLFGAAFQNSSASRNESPEIGATAVRQEYSAFVPLTVVVEFTVKDPVMGLNFISNKGYDYVYTYSNPFSVSTSSWLPCVDGIWERCTWEFEITAPNTLGDINRHDSSSATDNNDEVSERDMIVVCTGDLQQESTHAHDISKKVVTFSLPYSVGAQHIGIAIGPFVQTNLSELKESDDNDNHHSSNAGIFAYSLPGRSDEVVNTCMFMHKAVEYFIHDYGSYPFTSFSLVFVENAPDDMESCAGLSIVSERYLFPADVIDQIYPVTKYITSLLASQWCGVNIVPKYLNALWVTIGLCRYMTGMFLRKLMGNNEYRYRLTKDVEKLIELDVGKNPIGQPNIDFPIDKATLSFITLKAPLVLHILDRRLTKSGGSFGLSRAIPKLFLQAMSGDLTNGFLSSGHFQRICEKVSHTKLDQFFQEWVFGSGYPIFRITQRFNKKKMFVEMGIRQVQNVELPTQGQLRKEDFVNKARDWVRADEIIEHTARTTFTGPMTIRIHEADGTPYEHVVNIKDAFTKIDIQYNTKYKRLKRHLRQRDKAPTNNSSTAVAATGDTMDDGELDGVLLHSFGDVLSSESDMEEWRLEEWSKDEEDSMTNEAFEWLRVDSDFEWICLVYINQPDYMYASQLQQDRDVVAQYECIRFFAEAKPIPMYSTILVRTLMDRRYYYGIRVEAAMALAKYGLKELDWIGRYHLLKAFQSIFCFPDSLIPQANDFSDVPTYLLQKTIPIALSQIKDENGITPLPVKEFLLDLLRYNENSNNAFSDCYYLGSLMKAISNSLEGVAGMGPQFNFNFDFDFSGGNSNDHANTEKEQNEKFVQRAISEIDRLLRIDRWMPSYENYVSVAAISIKEGLIQNGTISTDISEFVHYTKTGLNENLRLAAFSVILSNPDLYSSAANTSVLKFVFKTIRRDASFRLRLDLIKLLGESIGKVSMYKHSGVAPGGDIPTNSFMIIEESGAEATESRQEEFRRSNIRGCVEIAKEQFSNNEILNGKVGILEKKLVIDTYPSLVVRLKIPDNKVIVAKNFGRGKVVLRRGDPPKPKPKPESKVEPNAESKVELAGSGSNSFAVPKATIRIKPILNLATSP